MSDMKLLTSWLFVMFHAHLFQHFLFSTCLWHAVLGTSPKVVSSFNRLSPDSAGGGSLLGVLQGTDVDPDPFGLRLW